MIYDKIPKYLSPSALINFENMPYTSLLQRLMKKPLITREPSGMPAKVGTAFDILVKDLLIKYRNCESDLPLEKIYDSLESEPKDEHDLAMMAGEQILQVYKQSGLVNSVEWKGVEKHTQIELDGVPLLGQLDGIVYDKEYGFNVPLDFKVKGYNTPTSPTQGFRGLYKKEKWLPAHRKFHDKLGAEEVSDMWALQFCVYGWLLGIPFGEEFPIYVHSPVYNTAKRIIVIADYRLIIGREFQYNVLNRFKTLWDKIVNGQYDSDLMIPQNTNLFANDRQRLGLLNFKASTERWF